MPQPTPEKLVASWRKQHEIANREFFPENEAIRLRILEDLGPSQAEHERLTQAFATYIDNNPWEHFNHDRISPAVKLRSESRNLSSNEVMHKIHSEPVPVVDEHGRIDTNIFIQPYSKRVYNERYKEYSDCIHVLGWQIIQKPEQNDKYLPKEPIVVTHKSFSKLDGLINFITRKQQTSDLDERLKYKAKLLEFERIKVPTIHRELDEHASVLELIERGARAMESIGMTAPKIGTIVIASQSE